MKRQIKFRAWNGRGAMFYADGKDGELGKFIVFDGEGWSLHEAKEMQKNVLTDFRIKGKVMQFTGLKSKNGKEVWEGDIIEILCGHCEKKHRATVIWIEDLACWGVKDEIQEAPLVSQTHEGYLGLIPIVSVLGNIYQNPELMKND